MNTNYPLTLVDFKTWLESKEADEEIGFTGEPNSCPIARVLFEEEVSYSVQVGYSCTTLSEDLVYYNPFWVRQFIDKVDNLAEEDSEPRSVLAKEALQIVNNLYICTVCNQYNPEGTNCGKKDNCPW